MPTHFLNNIFTRDQFSDAERERILPLFKQIAFPKNAYLLREGSMANNYWFIQSGLVRAYAVDTKGQDISMGFFTTGDVVIDWPSFFQRLPTRQNIQALNNCICWQLDFATFQELFHSSEAFREAGRARLVASYFELQQHSISMIVDQAKERYKKLLAQKPELLQAVPLKQIATYLGITDTSLSRIRKEIAKEGKS